MRKTPVAFSQRAHKTPQKCKRRAGTPGTPLLGPATEHPLLAVARLQRSHQVPREARTPGRETGVGLRPAQPAGLRTDPRVFRSARARGARPAVPARDCAGAPSGRPRGRSPAVAKAVARARRGASSSTKVTGVEDGGGVKREVPPRPRQPRAVWPFCRYTEPRPAAHGIRRAGPHAPQPCAEVPTETGRDHRSDTRSRNTRSRCSCSEP